MRAIVRSLLGTPDSVAIPPRLSNLKNSQLYNRRTLNKVPKITLAPSTRRTLTQAFLLFAGSGLTIARAGAFSPFLLGHSLWLDRFSTNGAPCFSPFHEGVVHIVREGCNNGTLFYLTFDLNIVVFENKWTHQSREDLAGHISFHA